MRKKETKNEVKSNLVCACLVARTWLMPSLRPMSSLVTKSPIWDSELSHGMRAWRCIPTEFGDVRCEPFATELVAKRGE